MDPNLVHPSLLLLSGSGYASRTDWGVRALEKDSNALSGIAGRYADSYFYCSETRFHVSTIRAAVYPFILQCLSRSKIQTSAVACPLPLFFDPQARITKAASKSEGLGRIAAARRSALFNPLQHVGRENRSNQPSYDSHPCCPHDFLNL